ncbi:MAG: efflux RND transporter permease subunit [Erysipelotrichaceae bacterium]
MISKFSVKKPYTVFVGVIMVILLGVISFMNSTTDLLPEMELPYVVVYTTYPGASAEKVESTVTTVLESSISTVENLVTMSSISSDNLSMIILEFEDDSNMDTVTINLNAKIDLVEGYLDDMVSTPTLMVINPNMMPVYTIAVDYEGMDIIDLSAFLNEELTTQFEKISGVASISTQGILEETVQIILNQEAIDDINHRLLASVDQELADGENELKDALKEVNDGLSEVNDGLDELSSTKQETLDELAQASVELQELASTYIAMQAQVTQLTAEQATYNQVIELVDYVKSLMAVDPSNGNTDPSEAEIIAYINSNVTALQSAVSGMETTITGMQAYKDTILAYDQGTTLSSDDIATATAMGLTVDASTTYAKLNGMLEATISQLQVQKESLNVQLSSLLELQAMSSLFESYDEALIRIPQLAIELETATAIRDTTKAYLEDAGVDVDDLSNLQSELNSGTLSATSELTKAEVELNSLKSTLESTQTELENALEELQEMKADVLAETDLKGVLNAELISTLLSAGNFSMPAGYITSDDQSILVKVGDEFASIDELSNLLLFSMDIEGLEEIYLSDIATVSFANNSEEIFTKVNGNDGIIVSFSKSSIASTTEVCNNISSTLQALEIQYPGLHFSALLDQGVYIDMIVSSVLENFMYGGLLAVLVLILFLKDTRPTLIIGLSIPISLMFSIVLMYFSGVTLNIISLSGLALGVGMLVDNSVVVVENIYRLRNEGVSLIQASIEGAKEMSGAIIASTLTTVCVFLPIVFTTGLARQLFVDMGLTIAYSLFASLIVALTLVPMLSSKLLNKPKETKDGFFVRLQNLYIKALTYSLKHKAMVLGGVGALFIFTMVSLVNLPLVLIPQMNSGQMSMSISLQDEEMKEDDVKLLLLDISDTLTQVEGIDTVGFSMNAGSLMTSMSDGYSFSIIIDDDASVDELSNDISFVMSEFDVNYSVSTSNMDLSALTGDGLSISIYHDDMDVLIESAALIGEQLSTFEGIDEVTYGNEEPVEEVRITVDKNEAMKYGLTVAQVYMEVAEKIAEETASINVTFGSDTYSVVIVEDESTLVKESDLSDLMIATTIEDQDEVALNEIATIEQNYGMSSIMREDSRRYTTVSASIRDGYNVSLVTREVEAGLDISTLDEDVDITFTGENETIMETMVSLVQMILLAIAFIYMIMVAQFQSLLSPFIVMFTIPLAFTGGLIAVMLTGMDLSITAMLGFLVLCGVVVNNGIVFIDYVNQLVEKGSSINDAVIETGKTRLRPILMTAMTTILAMTTMALGIGSGAEMMQGMAIVTIGGLTYSTVLTLFIVPILYVLFNKKRVRNDEVSK